MADCTESVCALWLITQTPLCFVVDNTKTGLDLQLITLRHYGSCD